MVSMKMSSLRESSRISWTSFWVLASRMAVFYLKNIATEYKDNISNDFVPIILSNSKKNC